MSVICAKKYRDKIVIAADSILVKGWSKNTSGEFSKLTRINGIIIGSVGSAQECSLMWHYMETHNPKDATVKAILDFISEFARWKGDYGDGNRIMNSYILAFEGKMFEIDGLFVHEINNYVSIGAGEDFGNAALYLGHSPREAVKVACDLSCYVAEPIIEEEMLI